jgi:putative ABC transport system substrate-binding protein
VISRREFVQALAVLVAAAARAQDTTRAFRLGILRPNEPSDTSARFTTAMQELGYVEGRNLVTHERYAQSKLDRLPALARELLDKRVDVILTVGAAATRDAKAATSSLPIVFFGNFDPVKAGFVASLAKPGGNVTGVVIAPDGTLAGKKLELLVQAVPGTKRVAVLFPEDPNTAREQLPEIVKAAAALGVDVFRVDVRGGDYRAAFDRIATLHPQSLFVAASTFFVRDRMQIIDLANSQRLPAMYEWPEQVEDGGLMAYGPYSLTAIYRRIAACVDRILKGANPGDIPVEQPSKLDLVVNLKTAKAIGLAIPQPLLLRADRVIE